MKKLLNLTLTIFFINILAFSDEDITDPDSIQYKNSFELNPTSEGFYVGYERFMPFSDKALLIFDIKNTAENGDDFGKAGFTYRFGLNPDNLLTGRLEAGWIDGHKNFSVRFAYDNQFFGCTLTRVKSLTDPETIKTEETVISSQDASSDTMTGSRGDYDVYNRQTVTTTRTRVRETRQATPDGYMFDLNFNYFTSFNLSLGASRFESEDWKEDGYHANLSLNLTQSDAIGAHYARIDDNEEGGIYYKKFFNSFGDIFARGKPLKKGQKIPLLRKFAKVPFGTPPIRIITASEYVEEHTEVTQGTKNEEVLVYNPPVVSQAAPVIDNVSIISGGPGSGIGLITVLEASDPNDDIVSWSYVVTEAGTGMVLNSYSGSWPAALPIVGTGGTSGSYNYTITVTDSTGRSDSFTQNLNF